MSWRDGIDHFFKNSIFYNFFEFSKIIFFLFFGCPHLLNVIFGQKMVNSNALRHFGATKTKQKKNQKSEKIIFPKFKKIGKFHVFGLLICYRGDLRQLVGVQKPDRNVSKGLK